MKVPDAIRGYCRHANGRSGFTNHVNQLWNRNRSPSNPCPKRVETCRNTFYTRPPHAAFSSSTTTSSQPEPRIRVRSNRRTNLIFGANTDVGKTIVSAGLTRACLANGHAVHYIKPLQSGGVDDQFIHKHAFPSTTDVSASKNLSTKVLFSWQTPSSPHVASRIEGLPCSDQEFWNALHSELTSTASIHDANGGEYRTTLIETAGGVLSPAAASPDNQSPKHARRPAAASSESDQENPFTWGWQPQADLYQPLLGQFPVVLVGDGKLGGISCTLSSLESLLLRGYDVAAVVFVETSEHSAHNAEALAEYAEGRHFRLRSGAGQSLLTHTSQSIVSLPPIPEDPHVPLHEWFASEQVSKSFAKLDRFLQSTWEGQVSDLQTMRRDGREVIWWPFTQHGKIESDDKVTLIDSASGDNYNVVANSHSAETLEGTSKATASSGLERVPMFDACASWWTQGIGHGESSMALSTAAAAGRYGHVIFPDVVHAPAVALSQKLVGPKGPGYPWAKRAFFTDNGSTGMEVALKMAMKTYQKRQGMTDKEAEEWHLDCIAQVDSYHGDTLAVMNMSEPSIFNKGQHPWYEPRGLFLEPPTIGRY